MIEVSNTPHGVKVDVRGDLDGLSDAAFVARGMTVYAGALFVSAKPVLLGGDAWLLRWHGPQAQAFWTQSATDMVPGAELLVDVDFDSLRPFSVGGRIGGAEIHAEATAIVVTHVPGKARAYAAQQ